MHPMCPSNDKVILAMSGGVDSSVAAALLKEQGYGVTGVFLCLGQAGAAGQGESRGCCSPRDAADARRVADKLGIPLFVLDVADAFGPIVEDFMDEYARGRTPNPCIHCNAAVKFGRLMRHADSIGVRYVATGHYARVVGATAGQTKVGGRELGVGSEEQSRVRSSLPTPHSPHPTLSVSSDVPYIARARSLDKDQSYALWAVARENVGRMLLPIGEVQDKARVRELARGLGLNVHDKPDSQEICFVADDDYVALLRARRPEALRPGRIVDSSGKVLGRHDGFAAFTIGQRHGLRVGGLKEPYYVLRIDPASADVVVGPRAETLTRHLRAGRANWHASLGAVPAGSEFDAIVQIRYNHRGAPGRVRITGQESFEVEFTEPVSSVTPGQAAVVYEGERLLGGGWIEGLHLKRTVV
ncbi:MAG: MnmA/TRMU family protein [Phycisphaerae bacterium]